MLDSFDLPECEGRRVLNIHTCTIDWVKHIKLLNLLLNQFDLLTKLLCKFGLLFFSFLAHFVAIINQVLLFSILFHQFFQKI